MIIEIPDGDSIVRWKKNDKDEWESAEISELIKAYEKRPTVPLPDFKEGYKQAIIDGKTNYSRSHTKYINHVNDNGHNIADCSVCGHAMQWHDEDEDGVPRFCWFCGAKIDSVED